MKLIIHTHCFTPPCMQFIPSHLSLLLPDMRSEPIICAHPFTHVLPSFIFIHLSMHASFGFTFVSPFVLTPLCSRSLLFQPEIMSSHYLHSSCSSSPSIYPLSLPSAPPRLSPPDRAAYYLHHSLQPSFLSHLYMHSLSKMRHTFTPPTYLLSGQTILTASNATGV